MPDVAAESLAVDVGRRETDGSHGCGENDGGGYGENRHRSVKADRHGFCCDHSRRYGVQPATICSILLTLLLIDKPEEGQQSADIHRSRRIACPDARCEQEAPRIHATGEWVLRRKAEQSSKQQPQKSCRRTVRLRRRWHAELHNQVLSYSGARSFDAPTIMNISVASLVKMKQAVLSHRSFAPLLVPVARQPVWPYLDGPQQPIYRPPFPSVRSGPGTSPHQRACRFCCWTHRSGKRGLGSLPPRSYSPGLSEEILVE